MIRPMKKAIFLFVLVSSQAVAEEKMTLDLGYNKLYEAQYIITVTGDFPVYNGKIVGSKHGIIKAPNYIAMMAYDVCARQERVPMLLNWSSKDVPSFEYNAEFKCEVRGGAEVMKREIMGACTHLGDDKHMEKICAYLEKNHGPSLVKCDHKNEPYGLPYFQ